MSESKQGLQFLIPPYQPQMRNVYRPMSPYFEPFLHTAFRRLTIRKIGDKVDRLTEVLGVGGLRRRIDSFEA